MWQDYVIMIGNFVFAIALMPSIFSKNKPAKTTCVMTYLMLAIFCYTFYTLNMIGSSVSSGISSALWLTLHLQQLGKDKWQI